jgi:hypothetical protein
MLTVIDGGGESTQHERKLQINSDGLVDISSTENGLLADQYKFETAIKTLNYSGKILLYKRLQKEISSCLKKSSKLLAIKNEMFNNKYDKDVETVCIKYKEICNRQQLIWKQIKQLYEILKAS